MPRLRHRLLCAATAALLAPLSGCIDGPTGYVYNGRDTLRRCWCDCNTLGRPAAFWDVIERRPYDESRVQYYRWLHGAGPGEPVWVLPAHAATAPVAAPPPTDVLPPPAPPSEPLAE